MEREIKFRAWDKANGKMIGHGYIEYFDSGFRAFGGDEFVLMQYVGLKDKNGREIYEGDILAAKLYGDYIDRAHWNGPPDVVGEVYWDLTGFRIKAHGEKDFRYSDFTDYTEHEWRNFYDALVNMCESESEIIGNIYANPDLLEETR